MSRRHFAGSLVVAVLSGIARGADAQSTASLERYERAVQLQVGIATASGFLGHEFGDGLGPLRAVNVGLRFRTDGVARMRLDAWSIERSPSNANGANYYGGGYLTHSIAVPIILSGEMPLHFDDLSLGPIIGVGWVPYARGSFVSTASTPAPFTRTSSGYLWQAGVSVRWRFLFVEQHLMLLNGVDPALGNGESAPLSFGVKF